MRQRVDIRGERGGVLVETALRDCRRAVVAAHRGRPRREHVGVARESTVSACSNELSANGAPVAANGAAIACCICGDNSWRTLSPAAAACRFVALLRHLRVRRIRPADDERGADDQRRDPPPRARSGAPAGEPRAAREHRDTGRPDRIERPRAITLRTRSGTLPSRGALRSCLWIAFFSSPGAWRRPMAARRTAPPTRRCRTRTDRCARRRCSPANCSGAMYAGVPSTVPVSSSRAVERRRR